MYYPQRASLALGNGATRIATGSQYCGEGRAGQGVCRGHGPARQLVLIHLSACARSAEASRLPSQLLSTMRCPDCVLSSLRPTCSVIWSHNQSCVVPSLPRARHALDGGEAAVSVRVAAEDKDDELARTATPWEGEPPVSVAVEAGDIVLAHFNTVHAGAHANNATIQLRRCRLRWRCRLRQRVVAAYRRYHNNRSHHTATAAATRAAGGANTLFGADALAGTEYTTAREAADIYHRAAQKVRGRRRRHARPTDR